MRPCDLYQEQISSLIDGELNPNEQRALAEHLRTCRECRRIYTAFRDVSAAINDATVEPPIDLTARIMREVRASAPVSTAQQPRRQPAAQRREPVRRAAPQAARPAAKAARAPVQHMPQAKPAKQKKRRSNPLLPIGTIAACLVLILGAIALFGRSGNISHTGDSTLSGPVSTHDSTTVTPNPSPDSTPPANAASNVPSAVSDDTECVLFSIPEESSTNADDKKELRITDPETIRSLSALLACDTETDPVPTGTQPVCILQDTDEAGAQHTCTVWIIGNDIVFHSSAHAPYYLAVGSADAFRQLLDLPSA